MRPYTLNPHTITRSHETFKDTRIHYATLNTQPHPNPPPQPPHPPTTQTTMHSERCVRPDRPGADQRHTPHHHQQRRPGVFSGPNSVYEPTHNTTPRTQGRRASLGDQQQKRSTQPHPHPATHPDHRSNERRGQPGTDQVCDPVRNQMKGEPPTPPTHPHTREQVSGASWSTHHYGETP
jgi:hypothetical protein